MLNKVEQCYLLSGSIDPKDPAMAVAGFFFWGLIRIKLQIQTQDKRKIEMWQARTSKKKPASLAKWLLIAK